MVAKLGMYGPPLRRKQNYTAVLHDHGLHTGVLSDRIGRRLLLFACTVIMPLRLSCHVMAGP